MPVVSEHLERGSIPKCKYVYPPMNRYISHRKGKGKGKSSTQSCLCDLSLRYSPLISSMWGLCKGIPTPWDSLIRYKVQYLHFRYLKLSVILQVVPGRAGGGSFKRKKNYIAKKEFAYRMCARWPTIATSKLFFGVWTKLLPLHGCDVMCFGVTCL